MTTCPEECEACKFYVFREGYHCCQKYLGYCNRVIDLCTLQHEMDLDKEDKEDWTREP